MRNTITIKKQCSVGPSFFDPSFLGQEEYPARDQNAFIPHRYQKAMLELSKDDNVDRIILKAKYLQFGFHRRAGPRATDS